MSDQIVAPETRDLDILAGQLSGWLARRLEGASDVHIHNLSYPRGAGQSHETILFDANWLVHGERVARGLVVRIRPTGHQVFPDTLFEEQYRLMDFLHKDGRVRVARIYWFEEDATLLGAPFFVMEKKLGRVPVSIPPYRETGWVAEAAPAQRAKLWENAVRQMAAVQSVPLEGLGFLRGATPDTREGLAQEWDKYRRFIAWAANAELRPVLEAGMARLEKSWPKNQPPGLVWGDARIGNMMFGDDFDVVAVMDWEQPSLGGALHDLAWFLVNSSAMHGASASQPPLAGMGSRAETIALWREITGIPADELEWYEEFTILKYSCCSLSTAKLGRYPLASPAEFAKRLKVALPR
ncbi:phosphotransferase family protein [Acidocella sp.]|uniref:phosphotransferase family protein n=1 Tax=Acidocella sp. TaxID=50710 RepID=UPI0026179727|nr:phosphotransferase family protein [Acidocella sp.]